MPEMTQDPPQEAGDHETNLPPGTRDKRPVPPSPAPNAADISQALEETPPPMLDVHPVHGPVTGWRDFFTHILIIAIGLCLAIALQETVEYLHHRYELAETRRALQLEREENRKTLAQQTVVWRWGVAELQNNLLVLEYLQQHPGTPQEKLPGVLMWEFGGLGYSTGAWDAARQSGVVALMPREEIEQYNDLYAFLQRVFDLVVETARAVIEAQRYTLLDSDPSHLNAAQIAAEIELTQAALNKQLLYGIVMGNLVESYPDFPPTVTLEEVRHIRHPPDQATQALLSTARALTLERLRAAGYRTHPAQEPGAHGDPSGR
jgi:hypothetical protein